MPIYIYKCEECGHEFDVIQKIKDDKLTEHNCEKCDKVQKVKKLIGNTSFKLSGRGWGSDGYTNINEQYKNLI